MKPRLWVLVELFSFAFLTFAIWSGTKSSAQINAPVSEELFRDKIVRIYVGDPIQGDGRIVMESRLEKVGDRWFLLGKSVSTGQVGQWDAGLSVGVPWDDVTAFYLFTPEQFEESKKKFPVEGAVY